jgi:hypothetical protein
MTTKIHGTLDSMKRKTKAKKATAQEKAHYKRLREALARGTRQSLMYFERAAKRGNHGK